MKNSTCKWKVFFLIILLLVLTLAMGVVLERELTVQTVPTYSYLRVEPDGDYELYRINSEGCWTYTQVLGGFMVESTVYNAGCTEEDIIAIIGTNINNFNKGVLC